MAFGAEELRVLRRALALAVHSRPAGAEDVRDCLRLAESLDEAMREGARLRTFLLADLARYRAALPGTAAAYLTLLEECLDAGHRPTPDDVTALQALRGNPVAASLLPKARATVPTARTAPTGRAARPTPSAPPASRRPTGPAAPAHSGAATDPAGRVARVVAGTACSVSVAPPTASGTSAVSVLPVGRAAATGPAAPALGATTGRAARLVAVGPAVPPAPVVPAGPVGCPGPVAGARGAGSTVVRGAVGAGGEEEPGEEPVAEPGERPAPGRPEAPKPGRRPVPTPGEVFPRRKPGTPGGKPRQRLVAAQPSGAPRLRPATLDAWTTSPHSFRRP